ncbi:CotH protein [Posidoniimonas polymericola]|uniref:CotH protein n=1 Tax=Posidoniimonas polymericola TaxID=2528002 RepID=A0A5C5YU21_9BACT|nr:lamin tail domain-containing protein [Posidoniimonas polymericola]TWT78311.1 CotH protein [Posidoniimonas polymericola]
MRRMCSSGACRLGFETLEPRRVLAAANLVISELMATNVTTLASGDGAYDDWIEIHNADSVAVNLGDYFLSDNAGDPTRWRLPATTLPSGGYLVVFASAPVDYLGAPVIDKVDGAGYSHTSFKLDSEGEALTLAYQDPGTHATAVVDQIFPEFPQQYPDVSYGVASDTQLRYFDTPTPGAANGAGLLGVVADTRFSVDRGFHDAPFEVVITSDTPDAEIYFTTDGSAPSPTNGELYTAAVQVDRTTVLRAAASKAGYLPTNVDTQTYLFLDNIVGQSRQAALDAGYPGVWEAANGDFLADYGFDPEVVGYFGADGQPLGGDLFGGAYAADLREALLSAPTISIVMDRDDLFLQDDSDVDGIYIDPRQGRNPEPERATSVEWITPDGATRLQVDAGIQMQGGAFRSQFFTRKHSFRLVFKDQYGPSELNFPLYGDGAVDQFNTLVLKATANDGYSWNAGQQTLQYARDQFGHSLQLAMGHASPHDAYTHLYINGMYWGVYSVQERPDAEFAESYLGVHPDAWDALHDDEFNSGDSTAWFDMLNLAYQAGGSLASYLQLQGRNPDGTPNAGAAPLLDVENYVDYLLINVWAGNDDWPHHNFWAGRDRSPLTTEGFQFFLWDFDGVMGNTRKWSPLDTRTFDQDFGGAFNVGQPHQYLQWNPEYQLQFADRVHRYFFNDGLLTPGSLIDRYQAITNQVQEILVAESARWGDLHASFPLTPADWQVERDWLLNTYLPQRSSYVMQELRDFGFYPNVDAPEFSQHGGVVPGGFELTMQSAGGAVYYTLDGSDPRRPGGALSGAAMLYSGQPIAINAGVTVNARAQQFGEWSALNQAEFSPEAAGDIGALRITELQYHPADFPVVLDDEDLEYLEILNTGDAAVSLDGVQITGFASLPYDFEAGLTVDAGERIVVARNVAEFQSFYGAEIFVASSGYSDRNLSNGGESVTLLGPAGQVIHSFTYSDDPPWPATPDGLGPSLEIIDPLGDASDPANWRASLYFYGSPGTDGLPLPGDYDRSGVVDDADRDAWRAAYGALATTPGDGADGNRDGLVNAADYAVWRDHQGDSTTLYGTVAPAAASPGPAAVEAAEAPAAYFAALGEEPRLVRGYDVNAAQQATSASPAQDDLLLATRPRRLPPHRPIAEPPRTQTTDDSGEDTLPAAKPLRPWLGVRTLLSGRR